MASRGFNRSSGPSSIPRGEGGGGGGGGQTQFGNFPRFPSPSPPVSPFNNNNNNYYYNSPPQQQQQQHSPPRLDTRPGFLFDSGGYEAPQRGGSHPLTLGRNPSNSVFSYPFEKSQRPTVSPPRWGSQTYQGPSSVEPYVDPPNAAVNIPARSANVQGPRRTRAPPIANNIYLDNFTQDVSVGAVPAVSPPRWGAHSKLAFGDSNSQAHQGPSSVPPYIASPSTTNIPARPANFQVSTRTKSPPYANEVSLDSYTQDVYGRGPGAPQGMQSPSQAFVGSHNVEDLHHPFGEASRWPTEPYNFQPPQKTRSLPLQSANEYIWRRSHPSQGSTDRSVVSSPSFGKPSTSSVNNSNSTIQQRSSFSPHNEAEGAGSKTMNSQVPKRNRSPSKASAEEHIPGTSYSTPDDTEREVQAKARRLARFGVELSQPVQRHIDHKQKSPANRHDQGFVERRKLIADQPTEATGEYMLSDYEGLEPSSVIIGLCPDMCPVSEREERERKGDLDKYERLDGDRNQTTISLAVKKYNRTAEREADLIRPMPVLQQTMEYLLVLLDQSYDDRFLGMYNFLWDRMRAIRMDLRMQHIFNQDAITMLEQMIRLHIIAMHELCEYTKGEGFSEGFDAHLNIEQMNKTSVELFQMYDDHRKKGSTVVSEKEFRGYYALLKLDKHPGYKVEPAELSLDLAKMTPETRQTPEILFARNVARACRTGNFIAFFRLARKATYLQACLMHAHFSKLRTQALVSLHSGLQNNQGIPIAQVTKWLGMEEEDIEGLLEYHGFLTKEFEEVYMVKEGPFLNADKDYPTKCSQLVHLKKSRRIIEDVSSSNQLMWPNEEPKQIELDKKVKTESKATQSVKGRPLLDAVDEVMLTLEEEPALIDDPPVEPVLETPLFGQTVRSVHEVAAVWGVPSRQQSPQSPQSRQQSPQSAAAAEKVVKVGKPTRETLRCDSLERNLHYNVQSVPPNSVLERPQPSERSEGSFSESSAEKSDPLLVIRAQEDDETLIVHQQSEDEEAMIHHYELQSEEDMVLVHQDDEEVAMAKLKLILRKWKRLSSKRKELREQRQLAASVALSSLTLGPPINQMKAPSSHVYELDIDRAVRERRERQQRSWSRMNISEVVGGILSERNPDAKCLCWKLIVCSQPNVTEGDNFAQRHQTSHLFSRWMQSKLMGVRKDNDDELVFLAPDLSIWKKWVTDQYESSPICCLSVVREVKFNALEDNVGGAGAILFLVSESTPLDVQKTQLHNLSMSLPSGSSVPLLIISGTQKEGSLNPLMIINGLGLHDVDKTRISSFSVCSLAEDQPPEHLDGIFSTVRLREGLQWLASQSPIQPVVHCIKTRELVMDHLSSLLGVLENMDFSVVEPNHCISAFNESLDRSTTEVANAAESNSSGWPCLEITLLESGIEHSVVKSFLPSVGWSSAAIVEPILGRIKGCKLPFFPDGLSWLNNGSDMGEEILHHKSELEKCLISYLTHSSNMMDKELATTEACLVLQKGALLELHGSSYRIRPKWAHIFRRIFNWRLMNLSSGEDSAAYVFEHRNNDVAPSVFGDEEFSTGLHSPDDKGLDLYRSLPCSLTLPSLDDMVGVCYNTCQFGREQLKSEANQPLSRTLNLEKEAQHAAIATYEMENEGNPQQEVETTETDDAYLSGNLSKSLLSDDYISKEVVRATNKGKKESDKLSKLLEQCNILQNKIDEKLSIYF